MMTYLNMFSHHRLKSRIGSSDDLTPNAEFSGALVVDGTREGGKRVRWNEQLGAAYGRREAVAPPPPAPEAAMFLRSRTNELR